MGGDFACDIRLQEPKERPFTECRLSHMSFRLLELERQPISKRELSELRLRHYARSGSPLHDMVVEIHFKQYGRNDIH